MAPLSIFIIMGLVSFIINLSFSSLFLLSNAATAFKVQPRAIVRSSLHPRSSLSKLPKENPTSQTTLYGIFDFFRDRGDDFVKLETTDILFGPGPIVLLYNVPTGITNEELAEMIADGAPISVNEITSRSPNDTVSRGVPFGRLYENSDLMDGKKTVLEGLECVIANDKVGMRNEEMMKTYNIIAREIYEESGGIAQAACAKAVQPAMKKSLKQVMDEISGDHKDAITSEDD